MLREVDAVHGLYYVVLRGWTAVVGDSVEAVRAFSAVGVGVAAAATVVLVARHQPQRVAVAAGLFVGVVPGLAWSAVDARSYAWSAALAVLATLALDSACRHRDRRRDWVLYGVVCLLACWWHLYLALLVVGHGIAVVVGSPGARLPWALAAAGTTAGTVPLGVVAWQQREQVAWLLDTDYAWHRMLLNHLTSAEPVDPDWVRSALLVGLLLLSGAGVARLWRDGLRRLPAVLALWGGLPTLVAIGCALAGAGMHPRYVTFAVPAYAIAATVGAFALPRWVPALAAAATLAATTPILLAQRGPHAKPGDLRSLAEAAAAQQADAVLFTAPGARSVASAYPEPFVDLVDLSAVPDPEPEPFFPGVRDPRTIEAADVSGRRVLVYGTREGRVVHRLRELGCRRGPVARDRHFVVSVYACPRVTRSDR